MTANARSPKGALLCFDGSADAANAIAVAGTLLGSSEATVVTVWEPMAVWQPYDPAAVLSAGVSRLSSERLGLDEIASEIAQATMQRGVELAREAGFNVSGELKSGKAWRAICEAAEEVQAAPIVLGARGLSRVQSLLLGSVSSAVAAHANQALLIVPAPPREAEPASPPEAGASAEQSPSARPDPRP
jgi:nucleotide-binding universal stress UspA family protein